MVLSNTWLAARVLVASPDAIVVTLDLDDALANPSVLTQLSAMYAQDGRLELAVGGMVRTDRSDPTPLPLHFEQARTLRGGGNVWQHLRSFRKRLFDRVRWADLLDSHTGLPYSQACDWAFMLPLSEMAQHARAITFPTLLYRAPHKSPESRADREHIITDIVARPPYARVRPTVAVVGHARLASDVRDEAVRVLSESVGAALALADYDVVTGGLGGVMEAAARGVQRARVSGARGLAIGLLPGADREEGNPFLDVALPTSLEHGRNALVAQCDALVVIGGGAGSLSEAALAWTQRRLVVAMVGSGGTADKIAGKRLDERVRYASVPGDCVYAAKSVEALLTLLEELLPKYHHRNKIRSNL